jgi:hypothetical protein
MWWRCEWKLARVEIRFFWVRKSATIHLNNVANKKTRKTTTYFNISMLISRLEDEVANLYKTRMDGRRAC